MQKKILSIILLCSFYMLISQNDILNEDIFFKNKFKQDWVYGLNSMNDGIHYTTMEYSGDTTSIEKYSYESGQRVSTVLGSNQIQNIEFNSYTFNNDETLLILETESESLYRHSKESIYYIYNIENEELTKISDNFAL